MKTDRPTLIVILVVAQVLCAAVFLGDVVADVRGLRGSLWPLLPEALASAALFIGIGVEIVYLKQLLQRKAGLEASVKLASSSLQTVIESHFDAWNLTPAERDVATLMVKGLSISEIAGVRGSAEGTVKAHLNAIYRKSGARNRAEVLSHIMDTLIDKPLLSSASA